MARHAVVLAGGSGTRLWPFSTRAVPKQLVPLFGGASLLDLALERGAAAVGRDSVWVCTGSAVAQAFGAAVAPDRVIVEPSARDTLAAICYACAAIERSDPEAVVAVLTADHVIEPVERFAAVLTAASELASRPGSLVTLGVRPTRPATGYGYLQLGDPLAGAGRRVSLFREKPDAATAEQYLAAGPERYLWNSGMFVWRASTLLDAADRVAGGAGSLAREVAALGPGPERDELWARLPRTSIDYGVMEPASQDPSLTVAAVPLDARWLDVGSWPSYGEALPADAAGNAVSGTALLSESSGCVVANGAPDHLVAVLGCEDLVVVHTPTATLVVPRSRAEEVKALQATVVRQLPDFA